MAATMGVTGGAKPAPGVVSGSVHNMLLGAASDTTNGFRVVSGLMVSLLRDGGWRHLVRPIDGKEFINESVEQWVLGEPWAGLHFPSWDALYAMLDRSEHGSECRERLIALGAPANGAAADARPVRKGRGRPAGKVDVINNHDGGTSTDYIAGRLKRDNPDLAADVIAGRLSAHAAAVQAGIRRPTWTAPADPERLAVAVERRFPGWRLVASNAAPAESAEAHYRADAAALPKRQRRTVEQIEAQLRAMFADEVKRAAHEEIRQHHPELVAELKAERDAYMAKHLAVATMKSSMAAILTEDDYRLLLNVLHPDRAPVDRRDRFARAFDAVRKLDPYIKAVKA